MHEDFYLPSDINEELMFVYMYILNYHIFFEEFAFDKLKFEANLDLAWLSQDFFKMREEQYLQYKDYKDLKKNKK